MQEVIDKGKLFTIIVPAYNVKDYIAECIESILNQTFRSFEVIIVDDGSTDGTDVICDSIEQKKECVRVIHQENSGLSAARNTGIINAKGKYLIFVDSDDYIEKKSLEKFAQMIESYDPEIVSADAWRVTTKKISRKSPKKKGMNGVWTGSDFLDKSIAQKTFSVCVPFNAYLKELIVENGLFFKTGILHEDLWWTPQIFVKATKVVYLDFVFYFHREREGSITNSYTVKNVKDMIETCFELQNLIPNKKILNDFLAQNYMSACYLAKNDIRDKKFKVNRVWPIRNTNTLKNYLKAVIFFVSPTVYFVLDDILKRKFWRE